MRNGLLPDYRSSDLAGSALTDLDNLLLRAVPVSPSLRTRYTCEQGGLCSRCSMVKVVVPSYDDRAA